MAKTSYVTTHGTVWGELTSATMTSYGHDALGSVTEIFSGSALVNTYRYKPYGATLAKTGTASDPSFLWNGGSGYRAAGLSYVTHYIRRRHFTSTASQWTTADLLWPAEVPYGYVDGRTITISDPNGLMGAPCCTPNAIIFNKIRTWVNQPFDITPGIGCEHLTAPFAIGAEFSVTFVDTVSIARGTQRGGPCGMIWEEWYSYAYASQYLTKKESCQKTQYDSCSFTGNPQTCTVYDVADYDYVNGNTLGGLLTSAQWNNGKSFRYNICIRLSLVGTCNAEPVQKYIEYTSSVVHSKPAPGYTISVDVKEVLSNCDPGNGTWY